MTNTKTNENAQGFYFNQEACIGCRTCQVACKDKNDLPVGYLFRKVKSFEIGEFPSVARYHYSGSCNQCENPQCVAVCPTEATFINAEDGTIQHDDSKCIGCQYCVNACPYGHPVYIEDLNITHRCDACIDLREQGEQPACVSSCVMRALEFGPIDELRESHPEGVDAIVVLPDPSQTTPSIVVDARDSAQMLEPRELFL